MSKLEIMVSFVHKLWLFLPILFIVFYMIKGIINKELKGVVVSIICLISYPIWQLLIYLVGNSGIKYGYIIVWVFKFIIPIFVIIPASKFEETDYFDFRKWVYIYIIFYILWALEMIIPCFTFLQ